MAGYLPPIGGILEGQAQATRIWFRNRVVEDHGLVMLSCDQGRDREQEKGETVREKGRKRGIRMGEGQEGGSVWGYFLCL